MAYWDWFGDGRVAVADIGLACCVVEFEAASLGRTRVAEPPPEATIAIVVAGTVTDAVAPLVRDIVANQPRPPVVISFSACACAGGPYWDSSVVTKGVDQLLEVDHYIPGCPPPPGSLHAVLEGL
ncbi:MAG: proton-conducting membrane transporter [Micropruina sp.]|nr:proton-conducting membrane transporter [Micropruina sp.]